MLLIICSWNTEQYINENKTKLKIMYIFGILIILLYTNS